MYAAFLANVYKDSFVSATKDMILLVLFGSTLSSIISYPLKTQGHVVSIILSAKYNGIS